MAGTTSAVAVVIVVAGMIAGLNADRGANSGTIASAKPDVRNRKHVRPLCPSSPPNRKPRALPTRVRPQEKAR